MVLRTLHVSVLHSKEHLLKCKGPREGASGSLPLRVHEFVRASSESRKCGERHRPEKGVRPRTQSTSTVNPWLTKANPLGVGSPLLTEKAWISSLGCLCVKMLHSYGATAGSMPAGVEPSLGTAQCFCDFKATLPQCYLLCSCVAGSKNDSPPSPHPSPTLWGQGLPLAMRGLGKVIKVIGRKKGSGVREKKRQIKKEMGLSCCKIHWKWCEDQIQNPIEFIPCALWWDQLPPPALHLSLPYRLVFFGSEPPAHFAILPQVWSGRAEHGHQLYLWKFFLSLTSINEPP